MQSQKGQEGNTMKKVLLIVALIFGAISVISGFVCFILWLIDLIRKGKSLKEAFQKNLAARVLDNY